MSDNPEFDYDVAISFLAGDLAVAQELTDLLRQRMNVFLFTERQGDIAGSDGLETLSHAFERGARLVVALHREGWGGTPWTRVEETAIKNRGLEHGWSFLLLIPLDETPLPKWVPKSQIWLSYQQYGLRAAVAVIERKLEEEGGQAKPATAASRAREHALEAEWGAERERLRRSDAGVRAAEDHLIALFQELEAASSAGGGTIAFKRPRGNAARLWIDSPEGEGTTVAIYWSRQWSNVLDQSGLRVRLWRGYAPAAGEDIVAFEEPRELGGHDFDFEFNRSRRWGWEHRVTKQFYDTAQLADFCVQLLLGVRRR